jgi:hypothetical protein
MAVASAMVLNSFQFPAITGVRMVLSLWGCSKMAGSSHPQKALRRRSSATPHKWAFEDSGEMAVFQRPIIFWL